MRISIVDHIHVITVLLGAVMEFGDVEQIPTQSSVFASHQKSEDLFDDKKPIGIPLPPPTVICAKETSGISTLNLYPFIHVKQIDINGVSTSGIALIGSARQANGYCTLKNVRNLSDR
ncbi:spore germination protein GerPE [Bacillus sp. FJAT-52991]|uniref:Spore germination protein GerPE n=1 Tax=Bacillus kandeliae TaxID=3129297 RepID=A0ABZ2N8E2_9BACI